MVPEAGEALLLSVVAVVDGVAGQLRAALTLGVLVEVVASLVVARLVSELVNRRNKSIKL